MLPELENRGVATLLQPGLLSVTSLVQVSNVSKGTNVFGYVKSLFTFI